MLVIVNVDIHTSINECMHAAYSLQKGLHTCAKVLTSICSVSLREYVPPTPLIREVRTPFFSGAGRRLSKHLTIHVRFWA